MLCYDNFTVSVLAVLSFPQLLKTVGDKNCAWEDVLTILQQIIPCQNINQQMEFLLLLKLGWCGRGSMLLWMGKYKPTHLCPDECYKVVGILSSCIAVLLMFEELEDVFTWDFFCQYWPLMCCLIFRHRPDQLKSRNKFRVVSTLLACAQCVGLHWHHSATI